MQRMTAHMQVDACAGDAVRRQGPHGGLEGALRNAAAPPCYP